MKFRTEIELQPDKEHRISHADGIVMLGSCFTDNVGALLARDGFNVCANPFGPLYNPVSVLNVIEKAISKYHYGKDDFICDDTGIWHCLDFASRYASDDPNQLAERINSTISELHKTIEKAKTIVITLGTAFVYQWMGKTEDYIVGNCHKFPANAFNRYLLSVEQASNAISKIISLLNPAKRNVIFTISPIRHVGDGLHGNQLSKSTLQLAVNNAISSTNVAYFPSYEIMIDDLRDYRFYAADMKHPSEVAIDYIYEHFLLTYCDKNTIDQAIESRKHWKRANHRPLSERE